MSSRERYKLYHVKTAYLDYLRGEDAKTEGRKNNQGRVPFDKKSEDEKVRPFVGFVIKAGECNYLAPLSSQIHKTQTDIVIKNLNEETGLIEDKATVRFAYMFPVIDDVLIEIDLNEIEQHDEAYAALLKLEINFINSHKEIIRKKARMTYENEINNVENFKNFCCNFKLLEEASKNYTDK